MLNRNQRAPWKGYLTGLFERVEAELLVSKSSLREEWVSVRVGKGM